MQMFNIVFSPISLHTFASFPLLQMYCCAMLVITIGRIKLAPSDSIDNDDDDDADDENGFYDYNTNNVFD